MFMAMEFFDFGSREAFCLFRWLTTEGQTDLDTLMAKAFDQIDKKHPMFEFGMSPSLCAKDELAELIRDQYLPRLFEESGLFADSGCCLDDGTDNLRSVTEQLLVLAANRICVHSVAEALLRHCGKWAPDVERPDHK